MEQSREHSELIVSSNMALKKVEIGVGRVIILLCPGSLIGNWCPESSRADFQDILKSSKKNFF